MRLTRWFLCSAAALAPLQPRAAAAQDARSALLLAAPTTSALLCRPVTSPDSTIPVSGDAFVYRYGTDVSAVDLGRGGSPSTRELTIAWTSSGTLVYASALFTLEQPHYPRLNFIWRRTTAGTVTGVWTDRRPDGTRAQTPMTREELARVDSLAQWFWTRRCR